MEKYEYNTDIDMVFSTAYHWHAEVQLPGRAQISEIHLRVYSFSFPENVYGISWGNFQIVDDKLQIPIEASRNGGSSSREAVRLAVDITYFIE